MPDLSLSLFGPLFTELDGKSFENFRSAKARALLIYLVVDPGVHQRVVLMDLLWPDLPLESAQTNLRQVVYQLRKAFPEVDARDGSGPVPLLLSERQTVQLNPEADVASDTAAFSALLEAVRAHKHSSVASCTVCQERLTEAVALYQGSFLVDFYLEDSDVFEEWAQRRREAYRRQVMDALAILAEGQLKRGEYAQSQVYAQRQLDLDNLDERAYRQLMEALARDGHCHEALAVYEEASRLLRDELGMSPAAQTTRLAGQIEEDSLEAPEPKRSSVRGYKLLDEVGAGAFGVVHRAYQPVIGREVVIKIIRPRYANHPDFIRRFETEAQTIARLEHPYIVPLYDYWREPDNAYLVMRWLRGGNLEERLVDGPMAPDLVAGVVDQLAAALYAAHRQHIIHRDVKAANILLDEDGNAYLSDFSVAKDLLTEDEPFGLAGSPAYLSPEQLLKEDISPQTDQYSLGIVIYQMLTGNSPFLQSSSAGILRRYILNEPLPLIALQVPGMPGTIDDVIQRATAKKPGDRFPDMIALARAFHRAVGTAGVTSVINDMQVAGEAVEAEAAVILNPYKGLRAFQESDAGTFFGREALVERLVGRIEQDDDTRFLAVVGPSGGGKSSAVKAGLLPALRGGAIPGSENWFITEMTPGRDPMEELAVALRRVAVDPPADLLDPLYHDERGLVNVLERILPEDEKGKTPQLLLLVDQFEELFTLTADEAVRDHFIDSLLIALSEPDSRLRVIATLRADFYDRPLQLQNLGELLRQRTEVVLPLAPAELERAITQPAVLAGVAIEAGLLARITADVVDQPGTLPLMQYALTELFERREDETMTVDAYREIEGVSGALGSRADEIYQGLNPKEQEAARQMFLRLVTLGEGAEDTRRRVLREELEALEVPPDVDMSIIIDTFGQYRLLTYDRDPVTRGPTVEVAHEALLREWPHLHEWLDESRADVRLQRLLAGETAEWQKTGQDASYLLRGARLDQYDGWPEAANVSLTEEEKVFLAASFITRDQRLAEEEARRLRELETAQQLAETEKQRAEEQTEATGRLRRRAIILAGALGIAALLAIAAFFFASQSSANAQTAEQHALAAEEQAALAAASELQALAEADARATAQFEAEENEQLAAAAAATADGAALAEAAAADEARIAQGDADEQRGIAEQARETAEEQALLARSRELAALSTSNLANDPELATLLAMKGLSTDDTFEAKVALHAAVLGSRLRSRLPAHEGAVDGIAYSPDGRVMVTTAQDEMARVWRAANNELLFETPINVINGGVHLQANFSPDSARLATLEPGEDFRLAIWDTKTWQRLETIELPITTEGMAGYSIRADLSQAAVGYEDGSASNWDLDSREKVANLDGHDGWVEPIYSPDGALLATYFSGGELGKVIVRDPSTGTPLKQVAAFGITFISLSPDNRWLAVASDEDIHLWDMTGNSADDSPPDAILRGHGGAIFDLHFSADGQQLASVSPDQTARIWDVLTGKNLYTLGHDLILTFVAFSPDGNELLVGDRGGDLRFWDLTTQGASELLSLDTGEYRAASLSPNSSQLVTGDSDGVGRIWDPITGQEQQVLEGHDDEILDIDFHPQGKQVATASADGTARVWDVRSGQELLRLEGHEPSDDWWFQGAIGVDFSPDGRSIATAGVDSTVRIWDAATGEELMLLDGPGGFLSRVTFSPDGGMLAAAGEGPDQEILIWDPATGQKITSIPAQFPGNIWGLAFSPDGSTLAASGQGGLAKLWTIDREGARGDLLASLTEHNATVLNLDFSPDGRLLATGTVRDVTRIWDLQGLDEAAPGQAVEKLLSVPGDIPLFNLEGDVLIALNNGIVQGYTLQNDRLLDLAASRVTRGFSAEECTRFNIDPCPTENDDV